jgi:sigma-B regulation protein RsbU (phosphoserine phosphatase)
MFVTAFYGQVEPATGELTYVNAGHNPPLLYHQATGDLQALARTGMALAVDQTSIYDQARSCLDPGDFVVLYTDGVTDAIDGQQQPFGLWRLRQTILARREASAEQIAAGIQQTLAEHVGSQPPFDDISVVVVKHGASRA